MIAAHLDRRGRSPRRMLSSTVSAMSSALCPVATLSACVTLAVRVSLKEALSMQVLDA